jgi:uncharacterized protein
MKFDWDPAKDALNKAKHGIDFTDASTVFDDPWHVVVDSTRSEFDERRAKAVGRAGPHIVTVIFTDRDDRRRIISARRASRDERRAYHQGTTPP